MKPTPEDPAVFRRVCLTAAEDGFRVEEFNTTQAFERSLSPADAVTYVRDAFPIVFRQLNASLDGLDIQARMSSKGKLLTSEKHVSGKAVDSTDTTPAAPHDRAKNRLLPEGQVIAPLVDMGVFTRDGRVVSSMYDKYRQINRFVELIADGLADYEKDSIDVIDFGCGKSYLTFVVYHYLTVVRGLDVTMVGLDLKSDVIDRCNEAARRYGYTGLHFEVGDIGCYARTTPPDLVITLHACDTATDLALANAVRWKTELIYSVPCCQHELNAQISTEHLHALTRYGIIQERFSALLTDTVRADLLEACGYRTQLLEFVDFEHTPKNILIRARRVQRPPAAALARKDEMLSEVSALCDEFHVNPKLLNLLQESGSL